MPWGCTENKDSTGVSFQPSVDHLVYVPLNIRCGGTEKCYLYIFNGYKKQLELPKRCCFLED